MQLPSLYYLILGRNQPLSIAEIVTLFKDKPFKIVAVSKEILLMETQENPANLMKRLGGTIKIGTIEAIKPKPSDLMELSDVLYPLVPASSDQKISFGLSAYLADDHTPLPNIHQLRELGMTIKRRLQENNTKARLVTSRERSLSSVIVYTNHLLDRGTEICLLFAQDKIYIGKTLAVQEFQEASERDFGRPVREMKVGMLPIQLAKIMINLAAQPLGATLLDPFCGFGTVLAEAALMGYKNLIGSDVDPKAIEATTKNLAWLAKNYELGIRNYELFQADTRNLSARLPPNSIDAIITEPYMGPTKGIRNHELGIRGLIEELSQLYLDAFREFKKLLKPNGRVVFIFPAFRLNNRIKKVPEIALPQIKKISFEPIRLISLDVASKFNILNSTFSILYSRPDQKVLREIFVFQKKD